VKGTVKNFNKDKGYGFITGEDGKDVFFHYSALQMDSYKVASIGDHVEFEVEESARGLRASKVVKL
jgi:CspA family cold shock protein